MDTQNDMYRKLQREINKLPIPYSETDSGVEIRLLKHLFSPAEAEIALNLNILPETLVGVRLNPRGKESNTALLHLP